ncbi:class I SAM-dependent methyltransferase [Candidatus Fermentibacteria bacterium]|nr:class I SAM-dependent methyltransferase [Candidatus Fermentibacteria bacterium]
MDVRAHNRHAWDRQVDLGNRWTIPVSDGQIAAARRGEWQILLTPSRPVPAAWFPALVGAEVLCLASGGGQQGPLLAAAGARVTVFDSSPRQLERDRSLADLHRLPFRTVEGDMRCLSTFSDASFDLIVHPVSNVFVPEIRPVWREAHRVLRPGGRLMSGITNPIIYVFDGDAYERGVLEAKHRLPYSDAEFLSEAEQCARLEQGSPLEFSHTLEEQIGGQIEAGFVLAGFFEDRSGDDDREILERFTATFIATLALKPQEIPRSGR